MQLESREDAIRYFLPHFADSEKRYLQADYRSPWRTWVGCTGSLLFFVPMFVVLAGSGPNHDFLLRLKAVAIAVALVGALTLLWWRRLGGEQTIVDLRDHLIYRGRAGKPWKLLHRFDQVKGLGVKTFLHRRGGRYSKTHRYYCPVLICDDREEDFQELEVFNVPESANTYIRALGLLLDKPYYEIEPDQQLHVVKSGELLGVGYKPASKLELRRTFLHSSRHVRPTRTVGPTEALLRKGRSGD